MIAFTLHNYIGKASARNEIVLSGLVNCSAEGCQRGKERKAYPYNTFIQQVPFYSSRYDKLYNFGRNFLEEKWKKINQNPIISRNHSQITTKQKY